MACMPLFSPDQAPDGHSQNLGSSRACSRRSSVGTHTLKRWSTFRRSQGGRTQTAILTRLCSQVHMSFCARRGNVQGAAIQRKPLKARCRSKAMRHAAREEHRWRTNTDLHHAAAWTACRLLQISSANQRSWFAERLPRTRSITGIAGTCIGRSMDATADPGRSGGEARACR